MRTPWIVSELSAIDLLARVAAEIARADRERPPAALDPACAAEQLRHAAAVERRRHDQELEILAQLPLHLDGECQSEIGIERALVKLVEQDRRNAFERGILEDQPREHALGDDLDPG